MNRSYFGKHAGVVTDTKRKKVVDKIWGINSNKIKHTMVESSLDKVFGRVDRAPATKRWIYRVGIDARTR